MKKVVYGPKIKLSGLAADAKMLSILGMASTDQQNLTFTPLINHEDLSIAIFEQRRST